MLHWLDSVLPVSRKRSVDESDTVRQQIFLAAPSKLEGLEPLTYLVSSFFLIHVFTGPQFDAHFANLTGREHCELYASIKGVPKEAVKEAAEIKLRKVGLEEKDWDRLSAGYSGGMKRRLSLACAMIGEPQIVL